MWLVDLNYNFESDWLSKLSNNMCLFFKSKFFKQASQQVADYSNHLDSIIQIKVGGGGIKDLKNQCVSQFVLI